MRNEKAGPKVTVDSEMPNNDSKPLFTVHSNTRMLLNLENCHLHFKVVPNFTNAFFVDLGPVLAAIFNKQPYLSFATCLNLVHNIGNIENVELHCNRIGIVCQLSIKTDVLLTFWLIIRDVIEFLVPMLFVY